MYKIFVIIFLSVFVSIKSFGADECNCDLPFKLSKNKSKDATLIKNLHQSKHKICQAKGYELEFNLRFENNNLDSAEYFLEKANAIYQLLNCGEENKIDLYENWAGYYYAKSDFVKAQTYSFKLLHSAELAQNYFEMATCNTMIAQLFNQTNQAEKGIIYTRKAVNYLPKITDENEKRQLLFLIAKRYLWHYQDIKIQSSLDSSELFTKQLLQLSKQLNHKISISNAFNNLQGVEFEKGNFNKALSFMDSAMYYLEKTDFSGKRTCYFDKTDICIEMQKYKEAMRWADSTLYYDKKLNYPVYIASTYQLKAKIAEHIADYKSAYNYKEIAQTIIDSVSNVDRTAAVTLLEKKYNQAKNESTIKDLAKQQQLYLMLAIIGFFAALAFAFYLRQQSLKHKKDILETEQRLNRARMNPHFFFNALTTLQKFALRDNDGQALASNLSKFSNIMRETLESTYKEYVTIEQEMEFLNEYLEVQKIRFPKTFSYEINAANDLEIDDVLIPSMIIQPFIENSIEHGFSGIDYPGNVKIFFNTEGNEILIEIIDNGKGLNTIPKVNNEHISRASQIIKDRIYLLNIKLKTKAGFRIDNVENGNGVIVKIHLPLLYKSQQ